MVKLNPGQSYIVTQPFTDFDGRVHPIGERWTFLRDGFVPYDSGLTWTVQPPEGPIWHIRLWWDERGQIDIIEHAQRYLEASLP